jgi:hypothetical protein
VFSVLTAALLGRASASGCSNLLCITLYKHSDHTLLAVAVAEYEALPSRDRRSYCEANALGAERLREISDLKQQLAKAVASLGFSSSSSSSSSSTNANARSWRVVRAAVCAGLAPSMARVRKPAERFVELVGLGAVAAATTAQDYLFFTRCGSSSTTSTVSDGHDSSCAPKLLSVAMQHSAASSNSGSSSESAVVPAVLQQEEQVWIHPASINYTTKDWSCPW